MAYGFLDIARTPSVKAAQAANGVGAFWDQFKGHRQSNRFTAAEVEFIAARDSFYLASVSETGWPYLQHRGGPVGFLRVIDDTTLAFADFRGNRQYISLGNVAANDRVALFLMDYPNRRRLKIYARIEVKNLTVDLALTEKLALPGYKAKPERVFVLHLEAFDWNCSQHIMPRFTEEEIDAALSSVRARIAQLEAENKTLREKLSSAAEAQNAEH
ncbi:MAG TPA: pyridoxamine 5'-phosphate oxidase family protein [Xanthobacteraceae bacterium]|jgi:predicted pyridoxine 5'-phosphate oxidase superfamily flavin-nucleotide-binding protein|nr:pyridoxamine 5'-phosphate oxidase family protein [Xanthobacteraceae bacterium]